MNKVILIKQDIVKDLKAGHSDNVIMLRILLAELENKKVDLKYL